MAITAEDIQNVSFSIDRKGYDVDEVDVFLERVADEIDAMNKQIIDLQFQLTGGTLDTADDAVVPEKAEAPAPEPEPKAEEPAQAAPAAPAVDVSKYEARIAQLEAELAEKKANDSAISQALIVAQRSADDIVANAKTDASNIIKDADAEASRIIDKAESDRQRVIEAIRKLESDRADVRSEYRDMLSNFMADAQKKLADIDGDSRRAAVSAQARSESHAASYAPASAFGASTVSQPTQAATPVSLSSTGFIDKDFSGYGDADDDFAFDDID